MKKIKQRGNHAIQGTIGQKKVATYIKDKRCSPLQSIQKPRQPGQPGEGEVTTNPREVDSIIREAWAPVYNGNPADIDKLVQDFVDKYKDHIFQQDPWQVDDISWQDIKHARQHGTHTAGGLDTWTKDDLYWVSDRAFQWLAEWFKCIEETTNWPEAITQARAVFLSKDESDLGTPLPCIGCGRRFG